MAILIIGLLFCCKKAGDNINKHIKGITIEIGGDSTKLDKALKSSNDKSMALSKELKEIRKVSKFDPQNIELATQEYDVLKNQAEAVKDKLNTLKEVQEQVETQNKLGTITSEQYRAFNLQLQKHENELKSVNVQIEKAQTKLDGITSGSSQQFQTNFENITQSIKDSTKQVEQYGTELQALDAKYAGSGKSMEELTAKKEVLNKIYDANKTKTEQLQQALDLLGSQTGTTSKEYLSLESDLKKATTEMYNSEKAVNIITSDLNNMGISVENLGSEVQRDFKNITESIEDSSKVIDQYGIELQALDAKYAGSSKSMEELTAKKEVLNKIYDANKIKTEQLQQALDLLGSQTGTTSKEYLSLERDLKKATTEMYNSEKALNTVTAEMNNLGEETKKTSKEKSIFGEVLKANLATDAIKSGLKAITNAIKGVADVAKTYVTEGMSSVNAMIEQEAKLQLVMHNTMDATEGQIQTIQKLISAQEEVGVVSARAQTAGSQELATYLEKSESLKTLIPVMNDMVAQQYGYNATAEGTVGIATMLGKVMDGQVGALSRYGYSFTETQEQILKYGTEAERAAVLTEVVGQSVGGMNEALGQTPDGQLIQLNNTLQQTQYMIGEVANKVRSDLIEAVLPSLNDIVGQSLDIVGDFSTAMQDANGDLGLMGKALGDFISDLLELIIEQLPQIIDVALNIITTLVDTMLGQLPTIIDVGVELIVVLVDALIQALPQLVNTGLEIIVVLVDGITQALPTLIPVALDALFAIIDTIIDNLDIIVDTAITLITVLAQSLIDALPIIIEKVPQIIISIVQTLVRNQSKIILAGIDIVLSLVNGIISAIPALVSATIELIKHIFENIEGYFQNIVELGKNIVRSFINGIRSMFSNLRRAVRDMFRITTGDDGVVDEAMEVMYEIGQEIVETQIEIIEEMTNVIKEQEKSFETMGVDLQKSLATGVAKGSGNVVNATRNSVQRSNNETKKGHEQALKNQEKAQQEQLKQQEQAQQEQLKQQEQFHQEQLRKQEEALKVQEETIKNYGNATVVALKESYNKQYEDKKFALDGQIDLVKNLTYDEVDIVRNGSQDKMYILSMEHIERIRQIDQVTALQLQGINRAIDAEIQRISLVDEGLAKEIKARQDRINQLEAEGEAERRELQRKREQERITNLEKRILEAQTYEEQLKAIDELEEYRQELERNRREEQRREEKNQLTEEIRNLELVRKEESKLFEERIKEQETLQQKTLDGLSESLKDQQTEWKEHFDELAKYADKRVAEMFLNGDVDAINELIETYNADWQTAGKTFMDYFKDGLTYDPIDLSELLQGSEETTETIKELEESLKVDNKELEQNYNETNSILEKHVDNIVDVIDETVDEIIKILEDLVPVMRDLGQQAMTGFYNGLVDIEPMVIEKAEDIATRIRDIISDAFSSGGDSWGGTGFSTYSSGLDTQLMSPENLEIQLLSIAPKIEQKASKISKSEEYKPISAKSQTVLEENKPNVYITIENFNNNKDTDVEHLLERIAFEINLQDRGRGKQ